MIQMINFFIQKPSEFEILIEQNVCYYRFSFICDMKNITWIHSLLQLLMIRSSNSLEFVLRHGITANDSLIQFTTQIKQPLTISLSTPVRRSSSLSVIRYTVKFLKKESRTAIGFLSRPVNEYMTPDYLTDSTVHYVSMGGAGYIYPTRKSASRGYQNGDSVTTAIDFQQNKVSFAVNEKLVGIADWNPTCDDAYFSISCEPGDVLVDISES